MADADIQPARADAEPAPERTFTQLVRAGCEGYVLKGIGLPIPAYVFHAVR